MNSIIFSAIKEDNFELFSNIINTYNMSDSTNEENEPILFFCCKKNLTNYAIKLIETYGDLCKPDFYDLNGNTCLLYAIQNRNAIIANSLLDLDRTWLTINQVNDKETSPLIYSIIKNVKVVFDRLISDSRININLVNTYGEDALNVAVQIISLNEDKKTYYYIEKLLEMDVNVNQKTLDNKSVLSYVNILPKEIISQILSKKNKIFKKENFKIYTVSDFINISDLGFEKGSFGQIQPVIERNTGKTKILKRYLNYDITDNFNNDIIKEIVYINMLDEYVVKLDGICIKDTNFYLVLEPLDMTFDQYFDIIRKLPNSENYILKIVEDLIKAVHYIHSMGILHNDLKYNNIMVSNGKISLIDFGFSKLMMFAPDNEIIKNYHTTGIIKAPDNKVTSYIYDDKVFKFETNRHSYSSDVYSLGVTLLGVILKDYSKFIYINGVICKIKDSSILIPLSEDKIEKIKDCGEYMYDLISGMIHHNSLERIKLSELVGSSSEIMINDKMSDYIFKYINEFQRNLVKRILHYSINEIKYNQNELAYINEIHRNYKNRIIKFGKMNSAIRSNIGMIIRNLAFSIRYKNKITLDVVFNYIILLRKIELPTKYFYLYDKSKIDLKCYSIFSFCTNVSSLENENFIDISDYTMDDIVEDFNGFILTNPKFEPLAIHIEYIVYKLQCLNVPSNIISEFEWYAIRMTIKFLIMYKEGNINMWNFTLMIAHKFLENTPYKLEDFEKNNEINIDKIERFSLQLWKKLFI